MRGLLVGTDAVVEIMGITPAYAGTTNPDGDGTTFGWDHPCICGDYRQG